MAAKPDVDIEVICALDKAAAAEEFKLAACEVVKAPICELVKPLICRLLSVFKVFVDRATKLLVAIEDS